MEGVTDMRSFLYLTLGGAAGGVILAVLVSAFLAPNPSSMEGFLLCAAVFGFFGAKFGAIVWAILAAVRLVCAIIDRVRGTSEPMTIDITPEGGHR